LLNIDNKISPLPIFVTYVVRLRYSNKQHLILAKFYINNASHIGNQTAKFQLNLPKQTIVTVAFVRSPQNTLGSGLASSRNERYFVIDIQQLISPLRNNIFQQSLAIAVKIYWRLSVHFYCTMSRGLLFSGHSVV